MRGSASAFSDGVGEDAGAFDEADLEELGSEVRAIDGASEDGFVDLLELFDAKALGQQARSDVRVAELAAQAGYRGGDDELVVERQGLLELANGLPSSARVVSGQSGKAEGEVGDADGASTRVTVEVVERGQLFEEECVDGVGGEAGLAQCATSGGEQGFVGAHGDSRQGECAGKGGFGAFVQEHLEAAMFDAHHDDIDGEDGSFEAHGLV